MKFYDSGLGDRLIDDRLLPKEIMVFLNEEALLLARAGPSFDILVEVGCMHGRYLDWAMANQKGYLGIDIVPRYIELGKRRANDLGLPQTKCQFVCGSAEDVDHLVMQGSTKINMSRTLLLFPFNSLGNMERVELVVEAIARSGSAFLISTYPTTEVATRSRRRYYEACSYEGLAQTENCIGVYFKSNEGLCSVAYNPEFLGGLLEVNQLAFEATSFANIGIAYHTPGILGTPNK